MIGGGFLGGGISIVPAGKAIIYASMTTEDGENIPNAVFKATRTGSTVTVNGSIDGRAELLVDAGHTYTVTVTPAGGSYLNRSQTVATASAKSYAVKFYLYPAKANEASTTVSLNALNTSISTHTGRTDNPHGVTKAQVGLGSYPTSPADIGISTATQTALDGTVKKTGNEEIAGIKTFAEMLQIKGGLVRIRNNSGFTPYMDLNVGAVSDEKGSTMITMRRMVGGALTRSDIMVFNVDGAESYATVNMRSSPSSSDVVNTKYVLDRVDEMVDYVNEQDALKADKTEVTAHTGRTDNPHSVTKAQVGLGNVNNTSDLNKPISTKTQTALDAKADKTALALKADKTALNTKADITFVNGAIQSAIQSSWDGVY